MLHPSILLPLVITAGSIVGSAQTVDAGPQARIPSPVPARVHRVNAYDRMEEDELVERLAEVGDEAKVVWRTNSHLLAGQPVSIGATYKATYSADSVVFTPALGKDAPHSRPFTFQLEDIRVGSTTLDGLDLAATPILVDGKVEYTRGAGVTEVYLATDAGLEQSFVFDSLPSLTGELVVSGRLRTTMQRDLAYRVGRALSFSEEGIAAVRIDKTIGFDANGRTIEGAIRLDGDRIELSLPREFLSVAHFPIVLDPLYSVEYVGSQPSFDSDECDIAAGAPFSLSDEFALVFNRYYSATDIDITAATFSEFGTNILTQFAIETSIGTYDTEPAVAYNTAEDVYVVAWQRSDSETSLPEVRVTHFSALSADVQPNVFVSLKGRHPDVGASRTGSQRAMVVWQEDHLVGARDVLVPEGMPPVKGLITAVLAQIPAGSGFARVAISKTDNLAGAYLVAAEENFTPDRDLKLIAINQFANKISTELTVTTIGPDEERPDVAAADEDFMLVFEREQVPGDFDADIIARKVDFEGDSSAATIVFDGPEIVVEADPFDDEKEPAVARANDEWVVVWQDRRASSATYDVFLATLDATTCAICEPETLVSAAGDTDLIPEIASTLEATTAESTEAQVAIAFNRVSTTVPDQVRFRLWDETGAGTAYSITGGSCTGGGAIGWHGDADLASTDFTVTLEGLDPAVPLTFLNVDTSGAAAIPCGPCSIQTPGLLAQGSPQGGAAQSSFKVPCSPALLGQTLKFQWISGPVAFHACGINFTVSETLNVTFDY